MPTTAPTTTPLELPQPSLAQRVRDMVETFATALILALVFRAYVVEAFVIPTGSMAPTLQGQHVPLRHPDCGWPFSIGLASDAAQGRMILPERVDCPNCWRGVMNAFYNRVQGISPPDIANEFQNIRSGDRILVLKLPFDLFGKFQPKRWDVTVFKNPMDSRQNYIKRLIGLPGETIEIVDGDIWVKGNDEPDSAWQIAHKPPPVQEAVYLVLHDADFPAMVPGPRDPRMTPSWEVEGQPRAWRGLDTRVFRFEPTSADVDETIQLDGRWAVDYNANNGRPRSPTEYGPPRPADAPFFVYVGDLRTRTVLTALAPGRFSAELSRRNVGVRGDVTINPDGTANLQIVQFTVGQPQATRTTEIGTVPMPIGTPKLVEFSFVDWRATLRVGDASISLDVPVDRAALQASSDAWQSPPRIAITAAGGAMELRHTRVDRDLFYRNARLLPQRDYERRGAGDIGRAAHGVAGNPIELHKAGPDGHADDDQFFLLGDNSTLSLDGRLWDTVNEELQARLDGEAGRVYQLGTVPRDYLVGRAFFVYWPYALPVVTDRFTFLPNFGQMRFIH